MKPPAYTFPRGIHLYSLGRTRLIKTISYETMDLEQYLEEIIDSRQAAIDYLESLNNETEQDEEMQTA